MGLDFALWHSRFTDYMLMRNWSVRTIEGYSYMLARFFRFLEGQEIGSLSELTRDVIYEYRGFLYHTTSAKGDRLAPRTQVLNLCAVKMFCYFLAHEHYILLDVAEDVELPKAPDTLPRVLLKEWEVRRLLEAPDVSRPTGIRDRAALELLYCSAIRSTECCELECADVDFGNLQVHVVEGKGAKGRLVPLGEEAAYWLELYLRQTRPTLDKGLAADRLFLNRCARLTTYVQEVKFHPRWRCNHTAGGIESCKVVGNDGSEA